MTKSFLKLVPVVSAAAAAEEDEEEDEEVSVVLVAAAVELEEEGGEEEEMVEAFARMDAWYCSIADATQGGGPPPQGGRPPYTGADVGVEGEEDEEADGAVVLAVGACGRAYVRRGRRERAMRRVVRWRESMIVVPRSLMGKRVFRVS